MSKKEIQKQRMYSYFIDACHKLIRESGIDQLTIRKISDEAGYNSATLYNYFENLDELVALALLDSVKPYFNVIKELHDMDLPTPYKFLLIWREYARHSFENPQTFTRVFESNKSDEILQYIDTYLEFFPDDNFSRDGVAYKLVYDRDMNARDKILLQPSIENGYIKNEDAHYLNDFVYAIHLGICDRIINGYYSSNETTLRLFMNYLIDFFLLYSTMEIDKEKELLLDEIMEIKIGK